MRLTPRAKRSESTGIVDAGSGEAALAVRVRAPPVEGAANAALIDLLAQALDVPRSAIAIESGERGRLKRLRIEGVDVARLERLVGA